MSSSSSRFQHSNRSSIRSRSRTSGETGWTMLRAYSAVTCAISAAPETDRNRVIRPGLAGSSSDMSGLPDNKRHNEGDALGGPGVVRYLTTLDQPSASTAATAGLSCQGCLTASQAAKEISNAVTRIQPSSVVPTPTYFRPDAKITKVITGLM